VILDAASSISRRSSDEGQALAEGDGQRDGRLGVGEAAEGHARVPEHRRPLLEQQGGAGAPGDRHQDALHGRLGAHDVRRPGAVHLGQDAVVVARAAVAGHVHERHASELLAADAPAPAEDPMDRRLLVETVARFLSRP
jgi:hypothetical protein